MSEQLTRVDGEKKPAATVTETFVNSVSTFHFRCGDFAEFCELLDLKADKYGEEKWRLFTILVDTLNKFDLLSLTKIVEAGSPKQESLGGGKPQALVEPPDLTEPPPPESSSEPSP
jgi:hypothetical protein